MIPMQKDRKPTPSEKRKELRKEKSRAAARCRRGRESEVFDDMLAVLPMPSGCREQLDKASVVRLAINYVKLREFVRDTYAGDCAASEKTFDVSAFGHFLLLLNDAGEIVYVTENVSRILGLTQFDLFGNSVYDFVHPCDHDDVRAALHDKESAACTLFSRMKCTLLPKGRAVHIKSASYKVVKFTGQVYRRRGNRKDGASQAPALYHLLLTGELIPNPAEGEVVMDESMFMTHHSLDMKISYYDGNLIDKLGYEESALLGTSLYDYVHASDAKPMEKLFKTLYSKGQISTERYRLLVGGGGYVWVVTQATVVLSKKTNAPKQIVCIHTVLSDVEEAAVVYAEVQRTGRAVERVSTAAAAAPPKVVVVVDAGAAGIVCSDTGIVDATEALFSDLNCDSSSCSEPVPPDEPKSDIFSATVSLFKDFDDDDWLAVSDSLTGAAELFDDDDESLRPMTPVDLSEGLLVDTSGLDASLDASLDEELEDMCLRAPYIPMCPSSDEIFAGSRVLRGGGSGAVSFGTPPLAAPRGAMGRPQALLLLAPSGQQVAGVQLRPSGPANGGFLAGSPQPGCSAPCSPSLPCPTAEGASVGTEAAGADALQTLWAQLSQLLSAHDNGGGAPTDTAVAMAAIEQSVNGCAGVEEQSGALRACEVASPSGRRGGCEGAAAGRHLKPELSDLLLTGEGAWLDDAAINQDSVLAASCTQERARRPQKRSLSPNAISATGPAQKKSQMMSPDEGTKPWPVAGRTAAAISAATVGGYTKTGVACPSEVEDGKRSLLLRLLLHGHEGRNGVSESDGRGNGCGGGGWLGAAQHASFVEDQLWA